MDENSPGMFQIIFKGLQLLQWNTKTKDGHTEKIGIILPLPLALVPRGIPYTVSSSEADKESKRTPVAFTTKDSSSPHYFLGSLQPSLLRTWTVLASGDFSCWSHWEPRTVYLLPLNHSLLWPTSLPQSCYCHMPTHPPPIWKCYIPSWPSEVTPRTHWNSEYVHRMSITTCPQKWHQTEHHHIHPQLAPLCPLTGESLSLLRPVLKVWKRWQLFKCADRNTRLQRTQKIRQTWQH